MLPPAVFAEIILLLRTTLPPPALDEPEAWVRRDQAAMAAAGGLAPETAVEARLAAQFVTADAYASDYLRLSQEARERPELARKCVAQGMSMMREPRSALNTLLRLQATRRAVAKDQAAASQSDWAEHAAVNMMGAALASAAARPVAADWKLRPGTIGENKAGKLRCETVTRLRPGGS